MADSDRCQAQPMEQQPMEPPAAALGLAPPPDDSMRAQLHRFWAKLGAEGARPQFLLAAALAGSCGLINKLQMFPMNFIVGPSQCQHTLYAADAGFELALNRTCGHSAAAAAGGGLLRYDVQSIAVSTEGCVEQADFVVESNLVKSNYIMAFGLTKAVMNFLTGVLADRLGRRWTMCLGWACALPMPLVVLFGTSWSVVSMSNLLLGLQQAICWSTSIFVMIDYAGKENGGLAVGLNETTGYVALALMNLVAPLLMDPSEPRGTVYWVVLVLIVLGLLVSVLAMRESDATLDTKKGDRRAMDGGGREDALVKHSEHSDGHESHRHAVLAFPGGTREPVGLAAVAFVYTSFIKGPLVVICIAGMTTNFISALAWGLLVQWLQLGAGNGVGSALDVDEIGVIVLSYDLTKGLGQFVFGFLGDRYGRKGFIVGGLGLMALALLAMVLTGQAATEKESLKVGFGCGGFLLGLGTTMMYSNNLAAVADYVEPSWRASALGTYRFWRDSGYVIGAVVSGVVADSVGIPATVAIVAVGVACVSAAVQLVYRDAPRCSAPMPEDPAGWGDGGDATRPAAGASGSA